MERKWGNQKYGRDAGSRERICVPTKRIQQREAEEAEGRIQAWFPCLGEGMNLNELTRLQGGFRRERSRLERESLVAPVQMRRHLKQSDAQMLGGAGDSPRMTARTPDSDTLEQTVALDRNRETRFLQDSTCQSIARNRCLRNGWILKQIAVMGKCSFAWGGLNWLLFKITFSIKSLWAYGKKIPLYNAEAK